MNILQIQHNFYPKSHGGTEVYTFEIAQELISRGHRVSILTPALKYEEKYGEENLRGVKFYSFKNFNQKYFNKILKENKIDIIHVYHLENFSDKIINIISESKVPFIVSVVDYWYFCARPKGLCGGSIKRCLAVCLGLSSNGFFNKFRYYYHLFRLLRRRKRLIKFINKASAVLPISYFVENFIIKKGIPKIKSIVHYWGINLDYFRQNYNIPKTSDLRIGYIGAISYEKGVHELIDAFNSLTQGTAELKIYGYGKEKYLNELKEKTSKNSRIKFKGGYDHKDISKILSEIDILVIPSIWNEAYGLVLLEGLAAKIPVIASDVGGISERIVDGINGFLYDSPRSFNLAEKLRFVIKNYKEIRSNLDYDLGIIDIKTDSTELSAIYEYILSGQNLPFLFRFKEDIKMISNFLRMNEDQVKERIVREILNPGINVKEAWNKEAPKTETEIIRFYKNTDAYIFDLTTIHKIYERLIWKKKASEIFKHNNCSRILDYGGGIGEDSMYFKRLGFQPDLFELPSLTADFARFRFQKLNLSIPVITSEENLDKLYDGIYATEVLEHVWDPIRLVKTFSKIIKKGGILLLTHSFELIGDNYPSHLKQNKSLIEDFPSFVEREGFKFLEVISIPGNRFYLFKKI
jgi:glycosyltransferase involved in cell wall biosynthesis/SAM-dependent methyltransferase